MNREYLDREIDDVPIDTNVTEEKTSVDIGRANVLPSHQKESTEQKCTTMKNMIKR